MKELNFEQMESIQGGSFWHPEGWHYSVGQHLGCYVAGALSGGGGAGVLAYVACLAVAY